MRGESKTTDNFPIVDTGQDNCYDDGSTGQLASCPGTGESFNGQDAQYSGNNPIYTNNGDDTITDNVTGLMWQEEIKEVSWDNAESDAASDTTGGYDDWRVPTIKELYSFINFNGVTGSGDLTSTTVPSDAVPYIDTAYFDFEYPTTGRYIDAQYITSTTYVSTVMVSTSLGNQEVFFGVNFADGRIKGYPKSGNPSRSTFYARYVRNNTAYGTNDFQDNNDNTITDNNTGLMWMKYDSGDSSLSSNVGGYTYNDGSLTWEEVLDFCENLSYAGYSDWRLPNAKELHSIVDYTRSPDTTDSAAIDPIFSVTSITDHDGNTDYPFFWSSTTHLDGANLGEWAVYIAFGEAEGFID